MDNNSKMINLMFKIVETKDFWLVHALFDVEGFDLIINSKNLNGNTLLHHLLQLENKDEKNCSAKIVKILIDKKINVNALDCRGKSPLFYACIKDLQVATLLVENGADINFNIDGRGWTLLHDAIFNGRTSIVELLIKGNIDTTIKDSHGKTALDIIPCNGNTWIRLNNLNDAIKIEEIIKNKKKRT